MDYVQSILYTVLNGKPISFLEYSPWNFNLAICHCTSGILTFDLSPSLLKKKNVPGTSNGEVSTPNNTTLSMPMILHLFGTWCKQQFAIRLCSFILFCALYFGLQKHYPFFYTSCASKQLAWQYPADWVQQNSPFQNPATFSFFFPIRPFPTNFYLPFPAHDPQGQMKRKSAGPRAELIQLPSTALPSHLHPAEFCYDLSLAFYASLFQP